MAYLGHSQFRPAQLPRQLQIRLTEELGLPKELAEIRNLERFQKSRVVAEVRDFLSMERATKTRRNEVEAWLQEGVAREEGSLVVLVNHCIGRLRELRIELPPYPGVSAIAASALRRADAPSENGPLASPRKRGEGRRRALSGRRRTGGGFRRDRS
ncbi:MAG: DUF4158 domain-containing protein [Candidatus Schekmanbacteria bacterium]|nr:DUF4158 domain-containing protein [Candidatus Schekmanbacteria bacterium]